MKILLLAPHPFYQERGTPIDVLLVLRVLSQRPGTTVDVLTYNEGVGVDLPNVRVHRIPAHRFLTGIPPGFSKRKLVCDAMMFAAAVRMARSGGYDLVHAGEEAVFIAMHLKRRFGIPYAYDLDSSIAQQMVEQKPWMRPLAAMFDRLERRAIRGALINFPVCNALADLCEAAGSRRTVTLHDISQLASPGAPGDGRLRRETGATGPLVVYSGNLQSYQGIDLLLESFQLALRDLPDLTLAVIGGAPTPVEIYRRKVRDLGIDRRCFILGPRPYGELDALLADADILACPRIRGINTPMKIFAYLHSGRPVLATDLPTHNQILTPAEALLAPATPGGFAGGMVRLARDPALREQLGRAGRAFVERDHVFAAHRRRLTEAYDWIEAQIRADPASGP